MASGPTAELRQAMARYSLDPHGDIIWDGSFHRFKTENSPSKKNGYYKAFPDRKGAIFGEWGKTDTINWQAERREKVDPATRKRWALEKKELEAKRKEQRKAAVKALRLRWKNASPDPAKVAAHPYIVAKKIKPPIGLKVDGDELLVPMRDGVGVLQNIQRIQPDGRKLNTKYADPVGCRMVIGRKARVDHPDWPIYIVEGWATGWAVHAVTGCMVVVVFNTEGLLPVTKNIQARDTEARIVIAGDNDRWSEIERGLDKIPNPGVWYARRAAEKLGVDCAIPDFKDLADKPTDFHDLYLTEGAAAVKRWLDPSRKARTVPKSDEDTGDDTEPAAPSKPAEDWVSTAPFRCLGSLEGIYYYLPRNTGEIMALPSGSHTALQLFKIAPYGWWDDYFGDNKRGWKVAADALMRQCHRKGMFQPGRLRGRGMWRNDDGQLVMHLGDRLLPPGSKKYVKPEEYDDEEGRIYARSPRLAGPDATKALTLTEARKLYGVFEGLLWQEEAAGMLLAGWTVLAPFSGALPWRPHVWLVGGAGSGKTTVLALLVEPLLGGLGRMVEGGSTEAGIRQTLKADALPVLYDEAERTSKKADSQVQAVLRLARSASSTSAETLKGTVAGKAMSFDIRSMFCLASIGGGLRQEADKSRVALLQLRSKHTVPAEERRKHWNAIQPELARVTPALGRRLVARTARWFRSGAFDELLTVSRSAAGVVLGDTRSGDQYGTLGAGAWLLLFDDIPKEEEMRNWYKDLGVQSFIEEQAPEGHRILSILLQAREIVQARDGARKVAVGEMVGAAAGKVAETPGQDAVLTKKKADGYLRQLGLLVAPPFLYISTQSEWVREKLADTPFADGWTFGLQTIPDVFAGPAKYFHQGLNSRTTCIPLEALGLTTRLDV